MDSGLAYKIQYGKKLKGFSEKYELDEKLKEKSKHDNVRYFSEYNKIQDDEILITIEYWYSSFISKFQH